MIDDAPRIASPLRDVVTERLLLRRFQSSDLDALAEVFAKREVWEWPYGRGWTREETESFLAAQTAHWNKVGFGLWLAIETANDRVIGFVGLSIPRFLPEILPAVEVGWRLDPEAWGKGYATEGGRAALREAFTSLGLDEVCSVPQRGNHASSRVAERIGMLFEREVAIPANDRRAAVVGNLYWMTRTQWDAPRST